MSRNKYVCSVHSVAPINLCAVDELLLLAANVRCAAARFTVSGFVKFPTCRNSPSLFSSSSSPPLASLVAASFSIFASVSSGTDTHYYYYVWSWSCGDCAVVVVFLVHNFSHPFHCTFFNYTLFSRAHSLSTSLSSSLLSMASGGWRNFCHREIYMHIFITKIQSSEIANCLRVATDQHSGTAFVWHTFILKCNSVNK